MSSLVRTEKVCKAELLLSPHSGMPPARPLQVAGLEKALSGGLEGDVWLGVISLSSTHTRTLAHSHTHTHTHTLTHSHSHTLSHTHTYTLTHSLARQVASLEKALSGGLEGDVRLGVVERLEERARNEDPPFEVKRSSQFEEQSNQ